MEFVYEDGLRLSELYGQLAGVEYALDHIWTTQALIFTAMGALAVVIAIIAMVGLTDIFNSNRCRGSAEYDDESKRPKDTWLYRWEVRTSRTWHGHYAADKYQKPWVDSVPWIICIVIIILMELATYFIVQDLLIKDTIEIQAQIDAILSKYQ